MGYGKPTNLEERIERLEGMAQKRLNDLLSEIAELEDQVSLCDAEIASLKAHNERLERDWQYAESKLKQALSDRTKEIKRGDEAEAQLESLETFVHHSAAELKNRVT